MCLYTINCKFYQTFTLLYKILQVLFAQAGNAEKTVSIHGTTQQLLKICSRTSRYPANFNVGRSFLADTKFMLRDPQLCFS